MKSRIADQYRRLLNLRAESLGQDIVYKQYAGMTPGRPALGIPDERLYTDHSTKEVVKDVDAEEVTTSGGLLHLGDIQLDVRLELTASYEDRLVIGSRWYRPVQIKELHVGELQGWTIYAREDRRHGQ